MVLTELKYILTIVNDLLKFAETKNGVIISFNSALIFGLFKLFENQFCLLPCWFLCFYKISIIILGLSILSSLIAFIPKITNFRISKNTELDEKMNSIYFKDLALIASNKKYNEYHRILLNKLEIDNEKFSPYIHDLINQISNNSRITLKKFKCFNISILFTLISIIILITINIGSP